jgi:carboxyl-terminal processing protease
LINRHSFKKISSMRQYLCFSFVVVCFCLCASAQAQSVQSNDTVARLYYTSKVWGYLKYFHPGVNGCNKNLDSILIALIPEIESDASDSAFNASLLKMFEFAGPMPTATMPAPSLTPEQSINLTLTWLNDSIFTPPIQALLDSIQVNFRPEQSCYYEFNPDSNSGYYYLINENNYAADLAITEPYRLLTLFRVWNIYDYFYPYKTLLDSSWDSTLVGMIPICRAAQTTLAFHLALMQFQSKIQDAHSFSSSATLIAHFGGDYLPMLFSYIDSQTVITKVFQGVTAVKVGDIVTEIDGTPTSVIRDSLRKYTPGGNPAVIDRNISLSLIEGVNLTATLEVDDGTGPKSVSINRSASEAEVSDSLDYWQGDGHHWKILSGDIGYVNMGIVDDTDLAPMFDSLGSNAPAIIFDMRNYPINNVQYELCGSYLLPYEVGFANIFEPDATYPGTGRSYELACGPYPPNPSYYQGMVILLVNEVTQSQQEFQAMALSTAPNVLIVGSQTAGADGNVISATYPTAIAMDYTSLGITYPNGTQTQRVGIVPNVVMHPTLSGIRAGLDEVLDTAILLAGGTLAVQLPPIPPASEVAFPNPTNGDFKMLLPNTNFDIITSSNSIGQTVWTHEIQASEIIGNILTVSPGTWMSSGIYCIRVTSSNNGTAIQSLIVKN